MPSSRGHCGANADLSIIDRLEAENVFNYKPNRTAQER